MKLTVSCGVSVCFALLLGLCVCPLSKADTGANGTIEAEDDSMDKRSVMKCPTTEADTKKLIIQCLSKGEKFLSKYFRKYNKNNFSRCSEYNEFESCIQPLLSTCPAVKKHLPNEWLIAIDLLHCACHGEKHNHKKCAESLNCLEEEMPRMFIERCGTVYKYNVKQKTQDMCHFLTEYIQCRERVVTSACGRHPGTLLYLAHKVAAWNKYKCDVRKWTEYTGFEYSSDCPRNFSTLMNHCGEESLKAKILLFHESNNLVPIESEQAIEFACMAYQNYKECIDPYNSTCPKGVSTALEYKDDLRTYLLKMEYICDTTDNRDFSHHVQCYQEVQEKGHLQHCFNIWTSINNWLNNLTAFQYYCQPQHPLTTGLTKELGNLRDCYEGVYTKFCSHDAAEAASLMGGLIVKAFDDPTYLRLGYRPNCRLHTMESLSKRVQHKHRHHHNKRRNKHKAKLKRLENSSLSKKEVKTAAYKGQGHSVHSRVTFGWVLLVVYMCSKQLIL